MEVLTSFFIWVKFRKFGSQLICSKENLTIKSILDADSTISVKEKELYIIAGCNGAGKTTASFTILPEIISCKEFVNADEITRGISPFQPEKVSFQAGRLMLARIDELINESESFAFEITL